MAKIKHKAFIKCLRAARATLSDLTHTLDVAARNEVDDNITLLNESKNRLIAAMHEIDEAMWRIDCAKQ